jgi:hypothetical protein
MELSEPYVLGLLAEAEQERPLVIKRLKDAESSAALIDGELASILEKLATNRQRRRQSKSDQDRLIASINRDNMAISACHQEVAMYSRKRDDIKTEMDRVRDEPGMNRKLRRQRAKLRVQIDERKEEVEMLRQRSESEREQLQRTQRELNDYRDQDRLWTNELDALQTQLPAPDLYVHLFYTLTTLAHTRLFLDKSADGWLQDFDAAISVMENLHQALRMGKYRLDKHSQWVGGRSNASVETLYGAVALGDVTRAKHFFEILTDSSLFFHQIFNVFRVWCLGLYLTGNHRELQKLLQTHHYASGIRGAYVASFSGLLFHKRDLLIKGLADMVRFHHSTDDHNPRARGLMVVSVDIFALVRLARKQGINITPTGPSLPSSILEHCLHQPLT